MNGTDGYYCESSNGKCPCKSNFDGDFCEKCADGYFGPGKIRKKKIEFISNEINQTIHIISECLPCECDSTGSLDDFCDLTSGQCSCNARFDGKHCDRCKDGYFNYPECTC